jgi:hypothetical protein
MYGFKQVLIRFLMYYTYNCIIRKEKLSPALATYDLVQAFLLSDIYGAL